MKKNLCGDCRHCAGASTDEARCVVRSPVAHLLERKAVVRCPLYESLTGKQRILEHADARHR